MINEQIRDREVRLLSETGEQLGIFAGRDAQRLADEKSLDLVKISPNANPPVCKIMDYSKFRFEQQKKDKEARKKQKQSQAQLKEIRLSPNIDTNDVNIKIKKCIELLKAGDKVKITMRFRGREMAHTDVGRKILDDFANSVSEFSTVDKGAKMEGRSMSIFLVPNKN